MSPQDIIYIFLAYLNAQSSCNWNIFIEIIELEYGKNENELLNMTTTHERSHGIELFNAL